MTKQKHGEALRRRQRHELEIARDERVLTVPISVTLAAETVLEFPSDLMTDVTVTTVMVEEPRQCTKCGGVEHWRGQRLEYACLACNPWEQVYWGPFHLRDRVTLASPRLAQTISCRSAAAGRDLNVEVRWWHAPDRLGGEPPNSVLVEVHSAKGTAWLVIGRQQAPRYAEEMREALRTAMFTALSGTHDLRQVKARWYRADGSEVRLVRGTPGEPDGSVWPLPLRT